MRLPFVSRERLESAERLYEACHQQLTIERRVDRERYDALVARVLSDATPAPPDPVRKDADPLAEVIRARAGNNGVIRRALGQYVKSARAQLVEEDDILKTITDWPSRDDEGVDG